MGSDREFFSDSKHGFQVWEPEIENLQPGSSLLCTAEVNIPVNGRYIIQFHCDNTLTIEFENVLYDNSRFPMLHNELREFQIDLKKGKTRLKVRLFNRTSHETTGKFTARLLDEEGNILTPERIISLPEIMKASPKYGEPDLSAYTAGTGKKFRSFGRFGFTKGDGVLDYSMPSFGIIPRPFISGHPHYPARTLVQENANAILGITEKNPFRGKISI